MPALGGGAQSDLLLQSVADASGLSLFRPEGATSGPSLGAAKLAALATGTLSRSDLARRPEAREVFSPPRLGGAAGSSGNLARALPRAEAARGPALIRRASAGPRSPARSLPCAPGTSSRGWPEPVSAIAP
ncbi:FGGY-family carbohydrate kinase [Alloyangia mangrovi]|uniref:FGGY-family carbohydrate kinase n=1 Tax=Alloyangia mangrovi TaxID=1779329 RepID=UPI0035D40FB3